MIDVGGEASRGRSCVSQYNTIPFICAMREWNIPYPEMVLAWIKSK